ncbi:MAG: hypothetical protein GZ094_17050 [Mariniphaga sp.]|nr:hypothetical protein [Mariniphaga sp.]
MTHFIRQQYLDIDLKGSESDGFALQHRLSDLYHAQLLPAIEKALDQCSSPDFHLIIDRLDIDIGTIEMDRIDYELTTSVAKALIDKITIESATRISGNTGENFNNTYFQTTDDRLWEVFIHFIVKGNLPWSYRLPAGKSLEEVITELLINDGIKTSSLIPVKRIVEALKSPNTSERLVLQFSELFTKLLNQKTLPEILKDKVDSVDRTKQGNLWEVFISFLLNGSFPVFYQLSKEKNLEEALTELLDAGETKTDMTVPVSKIEEALKSPYASKRLVFQFSELFIMKLLKYICPETLVELTSLLSETENLSFAPDEIRLFRRFVLEKTLLQVSSGSAISKVEIAKQVLDELQISTDLLPMVSMVFKQAWPDIKIPLNEPFSVVSEQTEIGQAAKTNLSPLSTEKFASRLSDIKLPGNKASTDSRLADEIHSKETTEGIYIENAGLVLLHPFLPRFFDALGISIKEEIVHTERALSLLHYLATGEITAPEYELVLPKVICNVPLSIPVRANIEITESEINEASALLDAVIKHWEVLQNTTPDGLRGTFLVRPGKLTLKEDGDWLLQVESRTFDVLLEHLPWGISMIKLPWMNNMLWVEWSS